MCSQRIIELIGVRMGYIFLEEIAFALMMSKRVENTFFEPVPGWRWHNILVKLSQTERAIN